MQAEQIEQVYHLFETTTLTLQQIADEVGVLYNHVWHCVHNSYSEAERSSRKRANYRASKTGDKNPMAGKTLERHHNWIGGRVSDGNGYWMVHKPEWYTGRKGSKYVFEHSVLVCEALGLTELPAGWVVHHIDKNPSNNALDNLTLLTLEAHARLHRLERVTTIPTGSRAKRLEARDDHC